MKNLLALILATLLTVGCSDGGNGAGTPTSGGGGDAYAMGQQMADATYGALPPQQMMAAMNQIGARIQQELESVDDKREYWDGFCDRGEEIWLARIDEMNAAMGQEVFNPGQIEQMFDQMRRSFRE